MFLNITSYLSANDLLLAQETNLVTDELIELAFNQTKHYKLKYDSSMVRENPKLLSSGVELLSKCGHQLRTVQFIDIGPKQERHEPEFNAILTAKRRIFSQSINHEDLAKKCPNIEKFVEESDEIISRMAFYYLAELVKLGLHSKLTSLTLSVDYEEPPVDFTSFVTNCPNLVKLKFFQDGWMDERNELLTDLIVEREKSCLKRVESLSFKKMMCLATAKGDLELCGLWCSIIESFGSQILKLKIDTADVNDDSYDVMEQTLDKYKGRCKILYCRAKEDEAGEYIGEEYVEIK